jgi:cyclopropane fatty-acyl-phospholipid synthase-like methyltransferase
VPPPATVALIARARRLVARGHDRLGLPFQVLLERLTGVLDAPALYAFVTLDVSSHLDAPRDIDDLAARVGVPADTLQRLLDYLASRGCVGRDRRGRYRHNRVSRLLTTDGGWRGWVEFLGAPWTMAAYAQLHSAVADGVDAIVAAHGTDFFGYLAAHSDAADAFHEAQAAGARLQAIMGADVLPLANVRAILDVGGGTGTFLSHVLAANPELRGAVCDLSVAATGAREMFAEAGVADRATFEGGDFFVSVPPGYDLHVLTAVVHDWSDDDCVRLLRNCAAALAPGGQICVVETELRPAELGSFVQSTDMLMLAFTPGGHERTAAQFEHLWRSAGLRCTNRRALPSGGTMFVLQPNEN